MSSYYKFLVIEFMDGSTERVGGTETTLHDGVLTIRTYSNYGPYSDVRSFPVVNIKSYRWEGQ
jgi:hypothetical protein